MKVVTGIIKNVHVVADMVGMVMLVIYVIVHVSWAQFIIRMVHAILVMIVLKQLLE